MPYKIVKFNNGYFVQNIDTGKIFSSHLMTKSNAQKQLKILNKALLSEKMIKQIKKNLKT